MRIGTPSCTEYHWGTLPALFVKNHQSAYIDHTVYFNKRKQFQFACFSPADWRVWSFFFIFRQGARSFEILKDNVSKEIGLFIE